MGEELLIQQVKLLRKDHPGMGAGKLYIKLQSFMQAHGIKLGRDGLFDLLSAYNLLIRKRKRRIRTTQSRHSLQQYPNQVKDLLVTGPNQLWVSDITYWPLSDKYCYISLITDAYARKIVGYQLGASLATVESIKALRMALSGLAGQRGPAKLIHHSDRGVQYCSQAYSQLLEKHPITISMASAGEPLENALAERVNGLIKEEYLAHYQCTSLQAAKLKLAQVVKLYHEASPPMSLGNYTPEQVDQAKVNIGCKRLWKHYYQEKLSPVN